HYEDKYKLLKFDLNLNLLYEKEYDKVLNGLVVRSIQCLNNQLYLFTHKQLKKENKYIVYGSKLNVMDGSIIGTPAELCAFSFISFPQKRWANIFSDIKHQYRRRAKN